jgi:outer membrane protein assembly factor BamB
MFRFTPTALRGCLWLTAAVQLATAASVTTHHNDNGRTGVNPEETILTPANVQPDSFGKLFSLPVSGQVQAQPLYLPAVNIPGQGTHNVLYVVTHTDDVYAFDADDGIQLWHDNLGTPVPAVSDIYPVVGILGTPVIDPALNAIFLVANTLGPSGGQFWLHSLDLGTGLEKRNSPAPVIGSVAGTGDGSVNGVLAFDPAQHYQRPAMLLENGILYFAFAGHQDTPPYHGWIFAYDATSLRRLLIKCMTPNGSDGGVWQGGEGLSSDGAGNIYAVTGNGTSDAWLGGNDYGMAMVKMSAAQGLKVIDYFASYLEAIYDSVDDDMGTGGVVIVPGSGLLVTSEKPGRMFVANPANLGGFSSVTDHIVQEWQATQTYFGSPVFFNSALYLWGSGSQLQAWSLGGNAFTFREQGSVTAPFSWVTTPSLSISANGTQSGIVWATYPFSFDNWPAYPGTLAAFDASNVTVPLWISPADTTAPDYAGSWSKWVPPTVVNGKVYIATFDGQVNVFGLTGGRQ